jgi:hypothetical protein
MDRYDPDHAPSVKVWLALDEGERIRLVEKYHEASRVSLPNTRAHAVIHVIVENQLASPELTIVRETLERLVNEGLGRHEALHAIGAVLAAQLHDALQPSASDGFSESAYEAELKRLSAKRWRAGEVPE